MTLKKEITLNSKDIYQGRIVNLRLDTIQLADGRLATREIIDHSEAVAIVALDKNQDILLVRQYRKAVEEFLTEIPAGLMNAQETPLLAAQRELLEETGFKARQWRYILSFFTAPGFCNEKIHLFLATDLSAGKPQPDEDEFIELLKIPLPEAYRMVMEGTIQDAKSIIGIQHAFSNLNSLWGD